MKNLFILILLLLAGCKEKNEKPKKTDNGNITINTEEYELVKSANSKALLILFPGGAATSKEIKKEFDILKTAAERNISVLLMNFNRHLWIEDTDSEKLARQIMSAMDQNGLGTEKIYIGGMSIGGTVALSLSNHLHKSKSDIRPEGVFIVDSPIDLYALYESEQKDVKRNDLSEERLSEPKFIIGLIEEEFGVKDTLLDNLQKVAPVTLKTGNLENIQNLKNTRLRFYTEPDTLWWEEVRQTDFESTNAYTIQRTSEILSNDNWTGFQLIQTKDKGYRPNGERHPHSWSIVDAEELANWILE